MFSELLIPVLLLAATAWAQAPSGDYHLTTQAELVLLSVGVQDANGQNVPNLTKGNFRVFENGKLQTITEFSHADLPVTTGLVIDSSGSMVAKRTDAITGGLVFIHASNPQDEMFITAFNDGVKFLLPPDHPFSDNAFFLRDALLRTRAAGRTALYDAIYDSLLHLKSARQMRKALVLISDGGDNSSTHNLHDVILATHESPATIFTIGVFDEDDPDRNPALLKNLARITGGQAFFPKQTPQIIEICREIARDIRSRYTIGYRPTRVNDEAGLRSIAVKVTGVDKVHVHARTSYYLPARIAGAAQ